MKRGHIISIYNYFDIVKMVASTVEVIANFCIYIARTCWAKTKQVTAR